MGEAVKGPVVVLSSSDEEHGIIAVSSEEDVVLVQVNADGELGKNNRKKRKKKTKPEGKAAASQEGTANVEELNATSYSVTEANDSANNFILKKLLRCPRYFDPQYGNLQACFKCGEDGHIAANCTLERQKPCFVCGLLGHNAKSCSQCFICKKGGHIAKDCPNKNSTPFQGSKICLRCGLLGHIMSSCTNDYAPEDLKEIQCYICNRYGHLCCADFVDTGNGEASCYNCGLVGHSGLGCGKSRGTPSAVGFSLSCYVCGKEGHLARGCTRRKKLMQCCRSELSTPRVKCKKKKKSREANSAPHDIGRARKKGKNLIDGNWSSSPRKPTTKVCKGIHDSDISIHIKSNVTVHQENGKGNFLHKKSGSTRGAGTRDQLMNEQSGGIRDQLMNERSDGIRGQMMDERSGGIRGQLMNERSGGNRGQLMNERSGGIRDRWMGKQSGGIRGRWMGKQSGGSPASNFNNSGWNSPATTPFRSTPAPWVFTNEGYYPASHSSQWSYASFSRTPDSYSREKYHNQQYGSGFMYGFPSRY